MRPLLAIRSLTIVALAIALSALGTGSARAARASYCAPPPESTTPFLPWGDALQYVLAPDGSFEGGFGGWAVTGAASIANDNEPFRVSGTTDSQALYLPVGSSATSAPICKPHLQPIIRFFLRNSGAAAGLLHVEVLVSDKKGTTITDAGTIGAGTSWTLSPRLGAALSAPVSGGVQITLTPIGTGAAFTIDDVYIDPYLSK